MKQITAKTVKKIDESKTMYVAVVGELTTGFKFVGPLTYGQLFGLDLDAEHVTAELIPLKEYYKMLGEEEEEEDEEKEKQPSVDAFVTGFQDGNIVFRFVQRNAEGSVVDIRELYDGCGLKNKTLTKSMWLDITDDGDLPVVFMDFANLATGRTEYAKCKNWINNVYERR